MKKVFLSVMILGIALVGACNRTANQAPSSGPQSKAPVSTPSSTLEPSSPSSSADAKSSSQQEPPSKELSKEEESTAMPRPGQGGADESTPAREPGAKG